jgi:predicted HTH transcriptional regulator
MNVTEQQTIELIRKGEGLGLDITDHTAQVTLLYQRKQVTYTENSSRPHGFGRLDPENFTPFPKNPVIARFFRQIGRADELGSGMRKMMKYSRAYGGADPELMEGDVFRMIVKVPEFGEKTVPESRQVPGKYPASNPASNEAAGRLCR